MRASEVIFWIIYNNDDDDVHLRQRHTPVGSYVRSAKPLPEMSLTTQKKAIEQWEKLIRPDTLTSGILRCLSTAAIKFMYVSAFFLVEDD
jgi:hypothetical protein